MEETKFSTTTGLSGSGNRRSGRVTKTVEKFDHSIGPGTPMTKTYQEYLQCPEH